MVAIGIEPTIKHENVYLVPSQSTECAYSVVENWDKWVCSCADWKYRHDAIGDCKHILYLKYWREMKDYLFKTGAFEALEVMYEKPSCPCCGSFQIKGHGQRKNKGEAKQRFKCLSCSKTFIQHAEFRGLKGQAKTVTACMDLYFKGCSLRKIQDHLKQFYGVEVHHETIRRWINKFMAHIKKHTDQFQAQTSKTWHVDELKYKNKQEWNWVWNVMDADSRFLLATNVTDARYTKDARTVFRKAKEATPYQPEFITSDGLPSYRHAIEKEFRTLKNRNTKHIAGVGIRSRIHNNKVERLHGTMRERLKVQRGLQSHKTTSVNMENFRTYYNFLRPHQALNGKTPAELADIKIPIYGKNKWLSMIKK
ncbi:MAG: DDE-type integrase/transposase/recombinase [Candidatus Micrarchaeota archaeon]